VDVVTAVLLLLDQGFWAIGIIFALLLPEPL